MNCFRDEDRTKQDQTLEDVSESQARRRWAPLAQIEGYWNALRGSRLLPLRSEIDPREFKGALQHSFDLEWIAPGIAKFRVAGSHLVDLVGIDMRGRPISSFLTADCQQQFNEMLRAVIETPATSSILLSAETGFGRPPLRARMNLLPVGTELGDTRRVIGALVSDKDLGGAPRRFSVEKIVLSPIEAPETIEM